MRLIRFSFLDCRDHVPYLNKAKELKHKADKESQNRTLQTVMYLEAVLYFILTGEAMEYDSSQSSYKMFNDTLTLIRHVSSIFRREITEHQNKIYIILNILR